MARINIAIDGPGSSGKGTVARGVARALDYQYIDTGAMYRAVALTARHQGISWADEDAVAAVAEALDFRFAWNGDVLSIIVNGVDQTGPIRDDIIGKGASDVSKHPKVRAALLGLQRQLGEDGGVVMDGRDIGTVVLPDAQLKVYLDADPDERARRRHEELCRKGKAVDYAEIRDRLRARDAQDMSRDIAPLQVADDGIEVDTTDLTIPQAIQTVLDLAYERGAS